jgi:8-oxo-dGTP pyrophosphatase MutT (NUDIX family)
MRNCYTLTVDVLPFKTNPYSGVLPDPTKLPNTAKAFKEQLGYSLEHWRNQGFNIVWLEIPVAKAKLVAPATKLGFTFHHATETYLMMTLKLAPDAGMLPYATHYAGVGGVVLDEQNNILVVRENMRDDKPTPFKLPGGFVDVGEHLEAAAVREVWEETGIKAQFESLVCVRLWHANRFGKSDFYFVCRLSPLTFDITPQEAEIAECRWMPVEEYLQRNDVHAFNKGIVSLALKRNGWVSGWFEGYEASKTDREMFMPRE